MKVSRLSFVDKKSPKMDQIIEMQEKELLSFNACGSKSLIFEN
jgi:hypothetical protein